MKKIYLILIITGLISCQEQKKEKQTADANYKQASYVKQEGYNKEDIQFLKDMGMTSFRHSWRLVDISSMVKK